MLVHPARPRRRRSLRRRFLASGGVLVALVVFALIAPMESLFYYPDRSPFPTPPGVEDVSFRSTDSLTLHGWFIPAEGGAPGRRAPAILVVHGNAGNIANHVEFASFLPPAGFAVFIFDYRSYGRSDRSPRSLNRVDLIADTNAALDALLARPDVDPDRVGLFGVSLGGAIGLNVAAQRPEVKAVCTVAAFARWKAVAAAHAGFIGSALIRAGSDPMDAVPRLAGRPLLIVHGDDDEVVPVAHATRLFEAARGAGVDVTLRVSPDATHNGLLWEDNAAAPAIIAFFGSALAR